MKLFSILSVMCAASAACAQVDSVANDGSLLSQTGGSWLASTRASKKGDILTVVISETSTANFTASTTATKKDSNAVDKSSSGVLDWLKIPLLKSLFSAQSNGANSSIAGTGTTANSQNFTGRLSVTVKEVLPNGNLVIEGTRTLNVNKDYQHLVFSGVVRRDDVQADNTVQSQNVSNAEIRSDGKGVISDRQRKGILTRILDWLF